MVQSKLLGQFLDSLGVSADQFTLKKETDRLNVHLTVPEADSGILIGHHGETIDALQTVLNLLLNHGAKEFLPVNVEINAYRQNRLIFLEELAQNASSQAVNSGREIILPPLTPYERRHVHLFLKTSTEVQTYSEGEGINRRLIIRPVKATEN